MIVRHANYDDLSAIADLTMLHSGGEHSQWLARLSEGLNQPGTCLLVAEDDGQIVGYGRVRRFDPDPQGPPNLAPAGYYLLGLVVHPSHRGRGIGEQLTLARMTWTAALAPDIWFFTNAANQRSLRLHQRLGFHEVTRDFTYPGVAFTGGTGVLCRARLSPEQAGS